MTSDKTYQCSHCGQIHYALPALGFNAPFHYDELDEYEKESMAELSEDFCVIRHPEQTDYFIRAVLSIPIHDTCETLDYGVWVSLSEKNFDHYKAHFNAETEEPVYFGTICNELVGYGESTIGLHVDVQVRMGGFRPQLILHEDEHPLVTDCVIGITFSEAEQRVEAVLRNIGE